MTYREWLVRPALFAGIGMTLFGNLDNAQHSWGGYLSHGWAPIAYLITFEALIRSGVTGKRRWLTGGGVFSIATVAMVISFNTLRHAAQSWGWDTSSAWLFPVIVDLFVIVLSLELAWSKETAPDPVQEEKTSVSALLATKDEETLRRWEEELSVPTPAPISAPPAPRRPGSLISREEASAISAGYPAPRASRSPWDVSRVAEMAVAGEPFSVAKESGIGASTYANVLRVAKLLREDPRRDLSTAGKLPNGEVVSAMRQRLVKA